MKNLKFYLTVLVVTLVAFYGCEKENDDKREAKSSLVLNENGMEITSWVNTLDFLIEFDEGGYHIQWQSWDENSDRVVYIELGGPVDQYELTTGTYYDTTSRADLRYAIDGIKFNAVDDGIVNVTNVNKANKTISGNFELKINSSFNDKIYDLDINGEFKDFPY
jgi:hypothetical protein